MSFDNENKQPTEFEERMLEVRRVTRVTTWWRRMSFRATILIWNWKGKIWLGVSKWPDVSIAVRKASREAYKNLFEVPITNAKTVPYAITKKFKSCIVKLIPASGGTGLKAGSAVRAVLELAWYENILSKIIGSNNKLNNALATIQWLSSYKYVDSFMDKSLKKEPDTNWKDNLDSDKKGEKKVSLEKEIVKNTVEKKTVKSNTEKKVEKKTISKTPVKKPIKKD